MNPCSRSPKYLFCMRVVLDKHNHEWMTFFLHNAAVKCQWHALSHTHSRTVFVTYAFPYENINLINTQVHIQIQSCTSLLYPIDQSLSLSLTLSLSRLLSSSLCFWLTLLCLRQSLQLEPLLPFPSSHHHSFPSLMICSHMSSSVSFSVPRHGWNIEAVYYRVIDMTWNELNSTHLTPTNPSNLTYLSPSQHDLLWSGAIPTRPWVSWGYLLWGFMT